MKKAKKKVALPRRSWTINPVTHLRAFSWQFSPARATLDLPAQADEQPFSRPDETILHEQETKIRSAQGQFAGRHHREAGQGRLQHPGQQPFLRAVCGRRRDGNPPHPRAGNQPLRRARLSRLRHHRPRLDHGERLEGSRGRRISVQQSFAPARALGAVRAGKFAGEIGERFAKANASPPRSST